MTISNFIGCLKIYSNYALLFSKNIKGYAVNNSKGTLKMYFDCLNWCYFRARKKAMEHGRTTMDGIWKVNNAYRVHLHTTNT
jgi:hypothetical protein